MNFKALKLKIASPEEITSWSRGEVLKAETINYRTQRPEKDGLFSERIFGPTKDYECYCGKYRRIRYKGIICDRCGVEITKSSVRRERMGHIKLATPVSHIWFLRTAPSKIGLFLNAPIQRLEKVVYYAAYIISEVNEENKKSALEELEREFKSRKKSEDAKELEEAMLQTKQELLSLKPGKILIEAEYFNLARRFADVFKAGSGAEVIRKILENLDLKKEASQIESELKNTKEVSRERYLFSRLKLIRSFIKNNMRPEWMILTVLPVLPPELRPMVALEGGRYATSDLNDLYRRVINRNNRLKKLIELKAPEIIVTNEKRMLQESIDSLIDNTARFGSQQQMSSRRRPLKSLADILKGKQGRFRQNLLGKRVDYSARSVIVVGPELRINECGLPKKMALELFKPFVIGKIIERGLAHNIKNANRLIETASSEIWEILEEVIANKKVLLNRAPTLHRLGIQAFKPILIEDLCIRIPPMVCDAFNADFDGDQMAVHLPLTEDAQKEANELMLASGNILKPSGGDPIVSPSKDIVLGCYYLTKIVKAEGLGTTQKEKIFSSPEEAILAHNFGYLKINELIKVRSGKTPMKASKNVEAITSNIIETSVGRLIFNEILPEDFNFVNKTFDKKELQKTIADLIEKYGLKDIWLILDKIKQLGFHYATLSGISWGMDDLVIPKDKGKVLKEAEAEISKIKDQYQDGLLTNDERRQKTIEVWEKAKNEIAKLVPATISEASSVYSIIDSGARGTWSQPVQMAGMKGLVQNPRGEIIELPIKSSYKEGLDVLEFFINTHGARKGLIDTALKTAAAGYLTRRLVDVNQDVVIREKDCGTTEGIEIFRSDGEAFGYNFDKRLFGRTTIEDIIIKGNKKIIIEANKIISRKMAEEIEKLKIESVKVRSPITCKSLYGICSKCYGLDLAKNELINIGEAVGIVAAQSIGEPGTQLTLRTFHTGGVAGIDITHGLPRVQELFEARIPKGKAPLAEADGVIDEIEEQEAIKTIKLKIFNKTDKKSKKSKIIEYIIPRTNIVFVEVGQKVEKGDQLSEGSIDLKELFGFKNKETVQRYVINEIQKIYVSEGTYINDKHIEIVVGQMFSRMMIKESGDTDFIAGEIVEKSKFLEVNREIKKKDKEPAKAKQLLTGITKTALSSESFLSAASFQETARILVMAAAEGRVDNLRGLKENVIIGRLIPAGTGYQKQQKNDN